MMQTMGLDETAPASDNTPDAAALNASAMRAMKANDVLGARTMLQRACALYPNDLSLKLNLAAANRALGDFAGAFEAVQAALILQPASFLALLMNASLYERTGRLRQAGVAYGIALAQIPAEDTLDPPARRAADHARLFHQRYQEELRTHLADGASGARSLGNSGESQRINHFIKRLSGYREPYRQQPMAFDYPGMPSIPFYDRASFPWLNALEAATGGIRSELLQVMAGEAAGGGIEGFDPYVQYPDGLPLQQWAELNRSPRWSAFHLQKDGVRVEPNCGRCPQTLKVLESLPQPDAPGRSPASMFSLLQPHTRIPPHTGVSNTRLVVHLPLVVPPGCGFRVGDETRTWEIGHAWVFDDTIEHEAWNDSGHQRAILIFDIWSPFLSEGEREVVVQVMNALDAFHEDAAPAGL